VDRTDKSGRRGLCPGAGLVALCLLVACSGGSDTGVSKQGFSPAESPGGALGPQSDVASPMIADLMARRSVLPAGGPFELVADAVVEAGTGAAAADLRVARLKAQARSRNWLPQVGPAVNLTALGGLAAGLLFDQALLDNGRRKAERDFAAADVEIAAVTLSSDANQRVFEGLTHYIRAEQARAQSAISERATVRLADFEDIMAQRVEGGVSDGSELRVLQQSVAEMRATHAADQQAALTAIAELQAMTALPLEGLQGIDALSPAPQGPEPLTVLRARGEGAQAIASAEVSRAEMRPGLRATANVGITGLNPGVGVSGGGMLQPGSRATIEALEATPDLVDRRIAEAAEDAQRRIVTLERQVASLQSRQTQGAEVLRQTAGNLELFTEQYTVGRRSLIDLVSQYDAYARLERDQAVLPFEIALMQLEIARNRGQLVDGQRL